MATFEVPHIAQLNDAKPKAKGGGSPCAACQVRHLAVCSALDGSELDRLNDILTHVEFLQGDGVFDEGEPAEYVFNITAGAVKLYKLLPDGRRQVTGFMFPGDFLGLANQQEYVYSAEALSDVMLCRFPKSKLDVLLAEFPHMESRLLGMARNELAEAHEQMLLLGRKTAKERIASFLLMLARRAERRGQPANPIAVPMSRNDIGDYLGLTTETVSRTLTRLRKSGAISLESDRKVNLLDGEALQELAEGF